MPCTFCNKKKTGLMVFDCKLCNGCFCMKHRMPEDHVCKNLESAKTSNQERLEKNLKDQIVSKMEKLELII